MNESIRIFVSPTPCTTSRSPISFHVRKLDTFRRTWSHMPRGICENCGYFSRRRRSTFNCFSQFGHTVPVQVQPQARLGRRGRLHCSAVAAVEAPPAQVNIAKDVSELIGQSTLAFVVYDPCCLSSKPVAAVSVGCVEGHLVSACRQHTYGVSE